MNRNTLASLLIPLAFSCALSSSSSASASRPWRAPPGPVWTRLGPQGDELRQRLLGRAETLLVSRPRRLGQRLPVKPPSPNPNGMKAMVAPAPPPPPA